MYIKGAFKLTIYIFIILMLLSGIIAAKSPDSAVDRGLSNKNAILLKNAQFDTSIPQPAVVSADILSISQYPDNVDGYYIVQFSSYIQEEWKQAVGDTGAVIFNYVPNNAFVVRMNTSVKSQVESLDEVQWIGIYQPSYRICPALSSAISAAGGSYVTQEGSAGGEAVYEDIIILLFDANDNERVLYEIEKFGGEIVDNAGDIMRVRINGSKIPDIAIMNGVSWIEKYVQPVILNDIAANITNVYEVRNTYGLTGSGQIVAVADSGLDTGADNHGVNGDIHLDFDNRVTFFNYYGSSPDDYNGHGTHTTGSVAGNGSKSSGLYKGMAPEANIISQGLGDDAGSKNIYISSLTLIFQDAYDNDARIHSNSWGSNVSGDYTSLSQETDQFAWNNKDFVIVFAAGNDDNSGINSPGTAKNTITVGATHSSRFGGDIDAIASFSSIGPTEDNRIKPDVVAPGTSIFSTKSSLTGTGDYELKSGTSMATPLTAGTVALIRQYYVENESISPSAALLKATLINGAANLSLPSNYQGWGRVDIEQSLFPALPRTMRYHDDISLNTSESWNVSYYIYSTSEILKITLVWTDYEGDPTVIPQLVNNLDLNVTGPSGSYLGNGGDDINNVEQVELSSPPVGLYTIKVNGTNVPYWPQPFALVISCAMEDEIPPSASGEFPANNSYTTNTTTTVAVNITDSGSGVNLSSINMTINGSIVTFTNTAIVNGYRIQNITSVPYGDGTINVTVNATDNSSNVLNHSWSFNVDGDAPIVTNPKATPATIESNGTDTTNLSVVVTDYLSSISDVTINLSTIGGSATAAMTNTSNTYWIITNATGANNDTYYLPVNATDNAGNSNTSVGITLNVNDTTPPILSDNMPSNGTSNLSSTISINATDKGAGINASSANMTVNNTQVTLNSTRSGFTFNFTNTTSATFSHGDTVNVTFNVSDNEGHVNNTSWMFYIDNVAPTIAITSPADGYITTASSITVSGTVNGTGSPPSVTVNDAAVEPANGAFNAITSLSLGANPIYANVTDAAGNTNSTLINIIRTTISTTSSSSSGGGGGGTSGEDFNNIAETQTQRNSIFKNDDVSYAFEQTLNPIIYVNFTSKISAGTIASKIEVLRNTSTLANMSAPGLVYKNINIWVGNYGWASDKSIVDATIIFVVPREWIKTHNIQEDSITLYRYNNDSWEQLTTSMLNNNEQYLYYQSLTPGFSPFAISGDLVLVPAPTVIQAPVPKPAENTSITLNNEIPVEPKPDGWNAPFWALLTVVVLSLIAIIYANQDGIHKVIDNIKQQGRR